MKYIFLSSYMKKYVILIPIMHLSPFISIDGATCTVDIFPPFL